MTEIAATQRRVRGYWFVDGFQEIGSGVILSVSGGILIAAGLTGSEALTALGIGVLAALAVPLWFLIRSAKQRLTYERTGYAVSSRRASLVRVGLIVAWAFIAGPLLAAFIDGAPVNTSWALAALAAGVATGAAWQAWRFSLPRFYAQAAAVAVTGGAVALAGLDFATGFATILFTCGASLIVTGAVALRRYLRENPATVVSEATS